MASFAMIARPASAAICAPAVFMGDASSLPEAWRRAVEALILATSREGQPWSCPGGRVGLTLDESGAGELTVEDASGRTRRRPVASPAEVVPLGEALLARTAALEPATEIEAPAATPAAAPAPAPAPAIEEAIKPALVPARDVMEPVRSRAAHGPQLLVDALGEARYSGTAQAVWAGGGLRASLLFGAWSVGLWGRYEAAAAMIHRELDDFPMSSVSVGLSGGYRFLVAPVELTATFDPSLAVVMMGARSRMRMGDDDIGVDRGDDFTVAKVDGRLGLRLGAAIPLT